MQGAMGRWDGDSWECPDLALTWDDLHAVWKHGEDVFSFGGNLTSQSSNHGTITRYGSVAPTRRNAADRHWLLCFHKMRLPSVEVRTASGVHRVYLIENDIHFQRYSGACPSMTRTLRNVFIALGLFAMVSTHARAAELSAEQRARLFLKVLAYDRSIPDRGLDKVKLLVLSRESDPSSALEGREMASALTSASTTMTVAGLPVECTAAKYRDDLDLSELGVVAIYLASGLEEQLVLLTEKTRAAKVLSLASGEEYVKAGASVAIVMRGHRPAVIVNLTSAQKEGASLDAQFLNLAEVIR